MTYAVILAGGVGTRFWPFSRELEPKQFMKIIGEKSLLESTVERMKGIISPAHTYVVTNNIYFYEVKSQVARFGIPDKNIILEPQGKNTAPAIGLCSRLIQRHDKEAVLVVLAADHYIKDQAKFQVTVKKAIELAKKEMLVTIGIKPKAPSTGYGYVQAAKRFPGPITAYTVQRFLEKPSLDQAKKYLKDKRFYWNSGMFVWKARVFLEEVEKFLPGLARSLKQIRTEADVAKAWPAIKPISVDYGIMEHSKRILLLPADFYWTDLGSWDALSEIYPKDKKGNISTSDTLNLGSQGVCVFSRGQRLVSTIGVRDMVIADTPDALLVCARDKTQEVKKLVGLLKSLNRKERLAHLTERRPWGSFTVLFEGPSFKIKIIEVLPGKRLSMQRHKKRSEHWVVVSGKAKISTDKDVWLADINRSVYIPMGMKHRLENPTKKPVRIVEVQTGTYLGEDDIERFEDDFRKECRPTI